MTKSTYVVVRQIRSRNISAVSVMNKNGILNFKVQNTAYTSVALHKFINKKFAILDSKNVRNCTFIIGITQLSTELELTGMSLLSMDTV